MPQNTENHIESKSFINLGVVFNQKGEVLMIRRVKEEPEFQGAVLRWAFPGGKQKFNESRKECVEREVLSETGYEIVYEREISMRVPKEFPIILVYHRCHLAKRKPIAKPSQPWEVAEVRWIKPQEIRNLITTDLDPGVAKELRI